MSTSPLPDIPGERDFSPQEHPTLTLVEQAGLELHASYKTLGLQDQASYHQYLAQTAQAAMGTLTTAFIRKPLPPAVWAPYHTITPEYLPPLIELSGGTPDSVIAATNAQLLRELDEFAATVKPVEESPSPEKLKWRTAIFEEGAFMLRAFGIQTERQPQLSNLLITSKSEIRRIASHMPSEKGIGLGACAGNTIFLQQGLGILKELLVLSHEATHFQGMREYVADFADAGGIETITTELAGQTGTLIALTLGDPKLYQARGGFYRPDAPHKQFSLFDEIFTEFMGYIRRLSLAGRHWEELQETLSSQEINELTTTIHCGSYAAKQLCDLIRHVAKKLGKSPLAVLKNLVRSYFTSSPYGYDDLGNAISSETLNVIAQANHTKGSQRVFHLTLTEEMKKTPDDFPKENPLNDPLIQSVVALLRNQAVADSLYL